jgi:hypothetical protein
MCQSPHKPEPMPRLVVPIERREAVGKARLSDVRAHTSPRSTGPARGQLEFQLAAQHAREAKDSSA